MPFAISPHDSARLEALVAAPSIASYAAANALSLTTLALWLQQPEIAAAHAALLDLRALDRRTRHDQLADDALDVLHDTMQASEDPIERRRCANTILRAIARANRPQQSRVGNHAEGTPNPTRAPEITPDPSGPLARPTRENGRRERVGERALSSTPSSDPSASHSVSSSLPPYDFEAAAARAEARQTLLRTDPTCPEVLRAIDANKPAPTPDNSGADPESLTDLIASRLAALPNPTGDRAYLAIYDAIQLRIRMNPQTWDPFKRALARSPFLTCREGWTRTDHPPELSQDGQSATRTYTWNHTDARTARCTLTLTPRGRDADHHHPDHWWINSITPADTS